MQNPTSINVKNGRDHGVERNAIESFARLYIAHDPGLYLIGRSVSYRCSVYSCVRTDDGSAAEPFDVPATKFGGLKGACSLS